jgi:hypothetical protein
MSQAQSGKMTLRVAPDVRRALETWAEQNLSTMRERAESAAEVR